MSQYDFCIVTDATGSMGTFLGALKQAIPQLQDIVRLTGCFQRVGILAYRDYCDEKLLEWSQWQEEPQQLLTFASNLRAVGGGDNPEAAKTALHRLLEVVTRPTLVLFYTDAPPHFAKTSGPNYARECEALGAGSDWVKLSRKLRQAEVRICPVITSDAGTVPYAALANLTQGLALTLPQADRDFILEVSIGVVLRWLGFETSHSTCYTCSDLTNITREEQLSEVHLILTRLTSLAPALTSVNLARRFKLDAAYRDLAYATLEHILTPDAVLALTYNQVFGLLWRAVCSRRDDPRRAPLIARLEDCIRRLTGTTQITLRTWVADSYRNDEEIREVIAACPTPFPAIILDLPERERLTPQDLLEVGRSCHPTALAHINRLLTNLRVVETDPGCTYLPLALADHDFWNYLPHLMVEGTAFSLRPAVVLALVAIRTQSFLAERARAFLARIKGTWFDKDASENYTLDFAKLVLSVPDVCTPEELAVIERIRRLGGLLINLRTQVSAELPTHPNLTLLPDHKVECTICHQQRSITLMTEQGRSCGCCIQGQSCCEEVRDQSYMVTCRSCQGLYAVVCRHLLHVEPKCHYCRHGLKAPLVPCTGCQNRYVVPCAQLRSEPFLCAPCGADRASMRHRMNLSIGNLIGQNQAVILAYLGLSTDMIVTSSIGSIYNVQSRFQLIPPREDLFPLQFFGSPVLNVGEVLPAIRTWVWGGTAEEFTCSLCFGSFSRSRELPVCGNSHCEQTACEGCLQAWYGGTTPGNLVLPARLACPFCRRGPKASVLKRHNRQVCEVVRSLQPLDPAFYHAWCLKCYRVRPCAEHACAEREPELQGAFVCTECRAPASAAAGADIITKDCPGCEVATEKDGGCNHITCPCGTHWCYLCEESFALEDIYDHLYEVHGGIQ